MAYNTPETVADYLARFQMEITHRGKGTFTPDHVKYSLTIANGGKDFSTTFESNPHVHGEPTITQVFGALASDAMVVRDYGMDEFVDDAKVNDFLKKSCMEFCGSLPGDEKDEDGYSLSGEAKDATASRDGLSRNQMGIEEKAAECKEAATVLANGNAL